MFSRQIGLGALILIITFALSASTALASGPAAYVINGEDVPAASDEWRFVVAVLRGEDPLADSHCTGSMVKPLWVLTAAHCYGLETGGSFPSHVLVGSNYKRAGGEIIPVTAFYRHASYDTDQVFTHDIMLLKLAREPANYKLIPLAGPTDNPGDGEVVRFAGWGSVTAPPSTAPSILQAVSLTNFPNARCSKYSASLFPSATFLCAGTEDHEARTVCSGDSGGPLVRQSAGRTVQVGVAAMGLTGCDRTPYVGFFKRVSAYRSWVASRIGRNITTDPGLSFAPVPAWSAGSVVETTIRGTGPEPTTITSVRSADDTFRVVTDGCAGTALARDASCSVKVQFRPRTAGPNAGSLLVTSDTEGDGNIIRLTGTASATSLRKRFTSTKLQVDSVKKRRGVTRVAGIVTYRPALTGARPYCGRSVSVKLRRKKTSVRGARRNPVRDGGYCTARFSIIIPPTLRGKGVIWSVRQDGNRSVRAATTTGRARLR